MPESPCCLPGLRHFSLAPLHARAKSRDHEIVRAHKEWPKAVPSHFHNQMECGHGPSSVVWSHVRAGPQPYAISMISYSCGSLHMIKKYWMYGCEILECHDFLVFFLVCFQKGVFENNHSDRLTWPIWCHVGFYVDFTSILHSFICLVPWTFWDLNLDRLRLYHQWECLKCNSHRSPMSCVKSLSLSLSL